MDSERHRARASDEHAMDEGRQVADAHVHTHTHTAPPSAQRSWSNSHTNGAPRFAAEAFDDVSSGIDAESIDDDDADVVDGAASEASHADGHTHAQPNAAQALLAPNVTYLVAHRDVEPSAPSSWPSSIVHSVPSDADAGERVLALSDALTHTHTHAHAHAHARMLPLAATSGPDDGADAPDPIPLAWLCSAACETARQRPPAALLARALTHTHILTHTHTHAHTLMHGHGYTSTSGTLDRESSSTSAWLRQRVLMKVLALKDADRVVLRPGVRLCVSVAVRPRQRMALCRWAHTHTAAHTHMMNCSWEYMDDLLSGRATASSPEEVRRHVCAFMRHCTDAGRGRDTDRSVPDDPVRQLMGVCVSDADVALGPMAVTGVGALDASSESVRLSPGPDGGMDAEHPVLVRLAMVSIPGGETTGAAAWRSSLEAPINDDTVDADTGVHLTTRTAARLGLRCTDAAHAFVQLCPPALYPSRPRTTWTDAIAVAAERGFVQPLQLSSVASHAATLYLPPSRTPILLPPTVIDTSLPKLPPPPRAFSNSSLELALGRAACVRARVTQPRSWHALRTQLLLWAAEQLAQQQVTRPIIAVVDTAEDVFEAFEDIRRHFSAEHVDVCVYETVRTAVSAVEHDANALTAWGAAAAADRRFIREWEWYRLGKSCSGEWATHVKPQLVLMTAATLEADWPFVSPVHFHIALCAARNQRDFASDITSHLSSQHRVYMADSVRAGPRWLASPSASIDEVVYDAPALSRELSVLRCSFPQSAASSRVHAEAIEWLAMLPDSLRAAPFVSNWLSPALLAAWCSGLGADAETPDVRLRALEGILDSTTTSGQQERFLWQAYQQAVATFINDSRVDVSYEPKLRLRKRGAATSGSEYVLQPCTGADEYGKLLQQAGDHAADGDAVTHIESRDGPMLSNARFAFVRAALQSNSGGVPVLAWPVAVEPLLHHLGVPLRPAPESMSTIARGTGYSFWVSAATNSMTDEAAASVIVLGHTSAQRLSELLGRCAETPAVGRIVVLSSIASWEDASIDAACRACGSTELIRGDAAQLASVGAALDGCELSSFKVVARSSSADPNLLAWLSHQNAASSAASVQQFVALMMRATAANLRAPVPVLPTPAMLAIRKMLDAPSAAAVYELSESVTVTCRMDEATSSRLEMLLSGRDQRASTFFQAVDALLRRWRAWSQLQLRSGAFMPPVSSAAYAQALVRVLDAAEVVRMSPLAVLQACVAQAVPAALRSLLYTRDRTTAGAPAPISGRLTTAAPAGMDGRKRLPSSRVALDGAGRVVLRPRRGRAPRDPAKQAARQARDDALVSMLQQFIDARVNSGASPDAFTAALAFFDAHPEYAEESYGAAARVAQQDREATTGTGGDIDAAIAVSRRVRVPAQTADPLSAQAEPAVLPAVLDTDDAQAGAQPDLSRSAGRLVLQQCVDDVCHEWLSRTPWPAMMRAISGYLAQMEPLLTDAEANDVRRVLDGVTADSHAFVAAARVHVLAGVPAAADVIFPATEPGRVDHDSRDDAFATTKRDSWCGVCHDGGLLIACEGGCETAFHMSCLRLTQASLPGYLTQQGGVFRCWLCASGRHVCEVCGGDGQLLDLRSGARGQPASAMVQCSAVGCGGFVHIRCIRSHASVEQLPSISWHGRDVPRVRCPRHKCSACAGAGFATAEGAVRMQQVVTQAVMDVLEQEWQAAATLGPRLRVRARELANEVCTQRMQHLPKRQLRSCMYCHASYHVVCAAMGAAASVSTAGPYAHVCARCSDPAAAARRARQAQLVEAARAQFALMDDAVARCVAEENTVFHRLHQVDELEAHDLVQALLAEVREAVDRGVGAAHSAGTLVEERKTTDLADDSPREPPRHSPAPALAYSEPAPAVAQSAKPAELAPAIAGGKRRHAPDFTETVEAVQPAVDDRVTSVVRLAPARLPRSPGGTRRQVVFLLRLPEPDVLRDNAVIAWEAWDAGAASTESDVSDTGETLTETDS